MAGRCTVCRHPDLASIDAGLVEGQSSQQIVAHYGSLSRPAVQRHKEHHLPAKLVRAKEVRDLTDADALMGRALRYEQMARRIFDRAEEGGDLGMALRAITTARNTLSLLVRMRETWELEQRLEALEDEIEKANRRKGRGYAI